MKHKCLALAVPSVLSGGDESRVSLTISKASHQDLGKYQCVLTSLHGSLSLDYLLTYEGMFLSRRYQSIKTSEKIFTFTGI